MKKTILEDFLSSSKKKYRVTGAEKMTIVVFLKDSIDAQLEVVLESKGSSVDIIGIVVGKKNIKAILNTMQHHKAPETESNLLIKSILSGNSKFQYKGMIRVEEYAQGTNAYQKNDNLLLSDKAHVETKPALEILADDVKCSHGATVGNIDNEQLFYLTSRGIRRKQAKKLIISGFLNEVVEKVKDEDVKNQLITKLKIQS